MNRDNLEDFLKTLPFTFKDLKLIKKVFVHRSYLNEKEGKGLKSNERLEYLGDSILSSVISDMLFHKYPNSSEGELTRMRAKLVNKRTLAVIGKELHLDKYMLLGKGERNSGGNENQTTIACAFEAFIAAIYIDLGYAKVTEYIDYLFSPLLDESLGEPGHFDFKPRLQEIAQKHFKEPPLYRLIKEHGPAHKKVFDVEVLIRNEVLGKGSALSKKEAEQVAAGEALKKLKDTHAEFFPDTIQAHGA